MAACTLGISTNKDQVPVECVKLLTRRRKRSALVKDLFSMDRP